MTVADYAPFVERMIQRYEGGYGWDRNDSGGPTKYGITCYDLARHRGQRMDGMGRWAPLVRAMTLHEADDIYATMYANPCRFYDLPAGSDCVVFDFGVNSGVSRSVRYAQMIVGTRPDGILGPQTLAAINALDPAHFITQLCDHRLRFLRALRTWSHFGRGWSARVADLRAYSLALLRPPKAMGPLYHKKGHRIPLAFPKAYGPEELRALEGGHE